MQQMFDSEIVLEDEGPPVNEILNFSPNDMYPKNPNFENGASDRFVRAHNGS